MKTLETAFEQLLREAPSMLAAPLILKNLQQQGLSANPAEAQAIAQRIIAGDIPQSLRDADPPTVITDEEMQELQEKFAAITSTELPRMISELHADAVPGIFASLKDTWPAERRSQARERAAFRCRLKRRWGKPIGKLRMLLTMAWDLGETINSIARSKPDADNARLVDVTTRLHARSCQVAEEVITLLEAGFPDGAMARWRTMHEIAVTAHFLSLYGRDAAQRYFDHQFIESYKAGMEYASLQERLNYRKIPLGELEKVQKAHDAMISKYGKDFGGPYGWAAKALKLPRPTFKDVEAVAGIGHLRSHYRMASHGVHANPKGILFSMAHPPITVLLTGPSNAGMTDPGHAAAISLTTVSGTIGLLVPSLDHQVTLLCMKLLSDEIGADLLSASEKLDEDERKAEAESLSSG